MNTQEVKKEDCTGHVQKRLGTALRSYRKKRCGAVLSDGKGTGSKDVTDPIIDDCMQTAMGMLSTITKVIKSLLLQLFGPYIITWSWAHQEKVLKTSILSAQMGDKTWPKYHKDEIFNRIIYDRSKCLPFVFRSNQNESINNMIWSKSPKRFYVAKADLLFLFVN